MLGYIFNSHTAFSDYIRQRDISEDQRCMSRGGTGGVPAETLRHKRPPELLHGVRGSWGAISGTYHKLWSPARWGISRQCVAGNLGKGISSRGCLSGRGVPWRENIL